MDIGMIIKSGMDMLGAVGGAIVSRFNNINNVQATRDVNAQNVQAQSDMNKQNIEMQRETNALNERLMREQWAREDTSYQRTVEDMNKAGINPLAMTGLNSGGQLTQQTAPQGTAFTGAVAPQSDVSGILESFSNLANNLDANMGRQLEYEGLKEQKLQNKIDQINKTKELLNATSGLEETIRHNKEMEKQGSWTNRLANEVITKVLGDESRGDKGDAVSSAVDLVKDEVAETSKNISYNMKLSSDTAMGIKDLLTGIQTKDKDLRKKGATKLKETFVKNQKALDESGVIEDMWDKVPIFGKWRKKSIEMAKEHDNGKGFKLW